jgi:hypothetical protein
MTFQALQKKPRPGGGVAAPDQRAQGLVSADPLESLEELFRDLRAAPGGLSSAVIMLNASFSFADLGEPDQARDGAAGALTPRPGGGE